MRFQRYRPRRHSRFDKFHSQFHRHRQCQFHRQYHRQCYRCFDLSHPSGCLRRCPPWCSYIEDQFTQVQYIMSSSAYGKKLNPYRRLRDPLGVMAVRQSVVVTNNPATIDQNQQLLVRFPNMGSNDVVVPGSARLAFTISLASTDANRTLVQNIGRAAV